jgi:ribosomal protein S18 acetylase RimI-like enzyme
VKNSLEQKNILIHLSRATSDDIPTLLKLEESVAGVKTYSPMLTKEDWLEEMQKSVVYLIFNGGSIVGNVSYEKRADESAYISGLAIAPQFQGQGIGRFVLSRILEELKDFKRIELVTHPENKNAIALYQSFGFTIKSREENYWNEGEPRLVLVKLKID